MGNKPTEEQRQDKHNDKSASEETSSIDVCFRKDEGRTEKDDRGHTTLKDVENTFFSDLELSQSNNESETDAQDFQ